MTKEQLAKEAVKHIGSVSFPIYGCVSSGATCDYGWDGEAGDLDLNEDEARGVVKEAMENDWSLKGLIDVEELFEDVSTESVDIEQTLNDAAYDAAYPEGDPTGELKEYVPSELENLAEEMRNLCEDDEEYEELVASIREKLQDIQSGDYTFRVDVTDHGNYLFAEDDEVKIELPAEKARGILYTICEDNNSGCIDNLFEDIDYEETSEDDIQNLVDKLDFTSYVGNVRGECEALDNFTHAWCNFIHAILTEKVTEDQLESCLQFFDEADFEEGTDCDFDEWLNEMNDCNE